MPAKIVIRLAVAVLAAAALIYVLVARRLSAPTEAVDPASDSVRFVGTSACIKCHEQEYNLWRTSDHALAMAVAADSTVLAPFHGETFVQHGIRSRFFRRDGKFMVTTEGPGGRVGDFVITYTFGYYPLQQYLVEFPDGKYQTLPLCWDTRDAAKGGQRWFHIYGNERIAPDDILFWTRIPQNWNYMCSECHSTNPLKNFDPAAGTYATSWSEIVVACEACHGPGSDHVVWGTSVKAGRVPAPGSEMGLNVRLKESGRGTWVMNEKTGNSSRSIPLASDVQLEICARCHSRRTQLTQDYVHGQPLVTTHLPALLEADLYFPDGQIRDEVYEYASFKQSTMYQKGVLCVNCHEPHSMRVYDKDNSLCYRCHSQQTFGSREHHFHRPDSTGGSCIQCHMPTRTYMQVDVRRDHSFRIPRPDLTVLLGVPNTCTACHTDKSARWASDCVSRWYGATPDSASHAAVLFSEGRAGNPGAVPGLVALAGDTSRPAILRGTALSILAGHVTPAAVSAVQRGLNDPDPLVRIGALRALNLFPSASRFADARHLLNDPHRAVRVEAEGTLAELPRQELRADDIALLESALAEYSSVQRFNSDHPAGLMNLGNIAAWRSDPGAAEAFYRKGIEREPAFIPQYINLSDLYRSQEDDEKGEMVLQDALKINPESADAHYALGLLNARWKNLPAALEHLRQAADLRPEDASYAYAYGVALSSTGNAADALRVLNNASTRHPYNQDILVALATIERDRGNLSAALEHAGTLVSTWPENQSFLQLFQQLQAEKNR